MMYTLLHTHSTTAAALLIEREAALKTCQSYPGLLKDTGRTFIKLTYGDLITIVDDIAHSIYPDLCNDCYVCLSDLDAPDLICHMLAIRKKGGIPVLLGEEDEQTINKQISAIVEHQKNLRSGSSDQKEPAGEDSAAIILFTSGSTAEPKGVLLSFNNLIAAAESGASVLGYSSSDRWLLSLPLYHIGGFSILSRAFLYGSSLVIPASSSVSSIAGAIKETEPTLISLVATQLKRLLDKGINPPQSLRAVLAGGGAIDSALMRAANSNGWHVNKVYGSTETAAFVTLLSEPDFERYPESAGKPLPGVKIEIIDTEGNLLPANRQGIIMIQSEAVMKGYINTDEQPFQNGFFRSGDLGYINDEGFLFITGRISNMIITGGKNVSAEEVENVLLWQNEVKDVCVIGLPDNEWGEKVTAVIVPAAGFDYDTFISHCKKKLAPHKIPKLTISLHNLPRNEMGKIDRAEIKKKTLGLQNNYGFTSL